VGGSSFPKIATPFRDITQFDGLLMGATGPDRRLSVRRRTLIALLLVDFLAYIPNFPEMGLETRPASMVSPVMMDMYTIAIFLPLITIAVVFKWPRLAGALAILCGVLNIIPSIMDLAHVLFPVAPPNVIALDEIVLILIGAALCTGGYRELTARHRLPLPKSL
jgi:hypothetical protein